MSGNGFRSRQMGERMNRSDLVAVRGATTSIRGHYI